MDTGNKLPSFTLPSTNGQTTLPKDGWTVLYIYEGDFLPVSASDILELDRQKPKFYAHGADIIAISGDSLASHLAWLISLRNQKNDGTPIGIELISDRGYKELRRLGMDAPSQSGTLIIDGKGVVRSYQKHEGTTGLNVTELERELLALQEADARNVHIPSGWTPGDRVLNPPPTTQQNALNNMRDTQARGGYCTDWYICFNEEI